MLFLTTSSQSEFMLVRCILESLLGPGWGGMGVVLQGLVARETSGVISWDQPSLPTYKSREGGAETERVQS